MSETRVPTLTNSRHSLVLAPRVLKKGQILASHVFTHEFEL